MTSCTLTVVYFSILQYKLLYLMPQRTFTKSFYQVVVTTDKLKGIPADLTAFTVSAIFNTDSYYKLHLNP